MSFQDVLYPLCATVNYGIAASRLPEVIRRRHDPNSVAFIGSFVALGTTFALSTPAIWVRVDAFFGAPNIAGVLAQCLVIAYTACIQLVLLNWINPTTAGRRIRWRFALAAATIAAMIVLFLFADLNEQEPRNWMAYVAGRPIMDAYIIIYLFTFLIGRIDVIRLGLSYGPSAGRLWLRRGLYWTVAGAVFGIGYFVARFADVAAPVFGLDPLRWETAAGLATVLCTILTMIGLTMPSWGPVLSRPAEWVRRYFEFRALHPLWSEITTPFPAIRLVEIVPTRPILFCRPSDLQLWLGRMKTEIRDAQMALGKAPHATALAADARTTAGAAGYHGDELEAVVQATLIEYGLEENAHGMLTGPGTTEELHGGNDAIAEVRFLITVSKARGTPIVSDILSRFREDRQVSTH